MKKIKNENMRVRISRLQGIPRFGVKPRDELGVVFCTP